MRLLALLLAALLCAPAAWAQAIRATVDRNDVTVQDRILLTVRVGSASSEPYVPPVDGLQIHPRGSSTQVSIVNGRQSMSLSYTYVIVPQRVGTFTLGPITAQVDGVSQSARPIPLTIRAAQAAPTGGKQPLFVTARVGTETAYVGQEVPWVLQFHRRVRIGEARLELGEFEHVLVEDVGEQREFTRQAGGETWQVTEIRKSLFPQKAGTLELPEASITVDVLVQGRGGRSPFDMFFGGGYQRETKVVRSRPATLEVKPLPKAPPGFKGLIGDFDLKGSLSRTELVAGTSTTLQLVVRGTGTVLSIPEPMLPDLSGFKVYDDKPKGSVDRTGRTLRGSRTFVKSLVPMEPGPQELGAVKLVYFDPDEGLYRTSTAGPFALSVAPAEGEEDLRLTESLGSSGKTAVRVLGDDIIPNARDLSAVRTLPAPDALLASALGLPPLLFGVALLAHRRRERYAQDGGLRRREGALKNALATARGATAAQASRAVRVYIGDKLGTEGSALTSREAEAALVGASVPAELAARVRAWLEEQEAAQYRRGGGGAAEDPGAAARELLRALDRALR